MTVRTARPVPQADADSAAWWESLREHRVRLKRCRNCERRRFPPMPGCPFCGSPEVQLADGPYEGTVYSWIVVRHAFDPAFADDVPYVVAMVELEEGVRLAARIDTDEDVTAGMKVAATFVDHEDWTELRFVPVAGES